MFEHDIDVAFAGDIPDRLAEATRLFHPGVVFRRADLGHRAPAFEFAAIDDALGAEIEHVLHFGRIGHDADGVGTGSRDKLNAEHAKPAGRAPHQHVVAWFESAADARTTCDRRSP